MLKRARLVSLAATGTILAMAALAGERAFPISGAPEPSVELATGGRDLATRAALPVFSFGPDGTAERAGTAEFGTDGMLRVLLYDDMSVAAPEGSLPILLRADARLLWAMMSDRNKAMVHAQARTVAHQVRQAIADVTGSAAFTANHRADIRALVQDAVGRAMADPDVSIAIEQTFRLVDRTFDKEFVGDYAALVAGESARALLQLVAETPGILIGEIDRGLRDRLRQVFDTPEGRQLIAQRMGEIAQSEETAELFESFARSTIAELFGDPRSFRALERIASDPAFTDQIEAIELAFVATAREVARQLLAIDGDEGMHPLAAVVLRALLFDGSQWMVAFVTSDEFDRLRDAVPGGAIALVTRSR